MSYTPCNSQLNSNTDTQQADNKPDNCNLLDLHESEFTTHMVASSIFWCQWGTGAVGSYGAPPPVGGDSEESVPLDAVELISSKSCGRRDGAASAAYACGAEVGYERRCQSAHDQGCAIRWGFPADMWESRRVERFADKEALRYYPKDGGDRPERVHSSGLRL